MNSRFVGTPLKEYHTEIHWRDTMNYAAAVEDLNPLYFDDERPEGIVAHPLFCVAVTWPILERIWEYIEADDFPRHLIPTQVHYTEQLEFHRLIKPGDSLTIKGKIAAILPHRLGTHVVIRLDACDKDGSPVFTEHIGALLRGVRCTDEGRGSDMLPPVPTGPDDGPLIWEAVIQLTPCVPSSTTGVPAFSFPSTPRNNSLTRWGCPALIIYTTGTTGEPKPALLCHENIIVQNEILARGVGMESTLRLLINLPPSHVGCVTEGFMTTMFVGGTTVLLRVFDVGMTLEAVEKHKVNTMGQIPTQYRMLWAHPDYDKVDLSSLDFVVYAGSAVDVEFLRKLSQMAPNFGTGIGMTENAGFATFTPPGISPEEMAGQVGRPFPDLAPVTIRKPMNEDGTAGEELPDGEIGEICYHGPIVFLGYYNQPEETAKVISKEGILYTGDLGYFKDMGPYRALFLAGRLKFVIKQKGYNVFPGEVEDHIAQLEGVDVVEVVGMKHRLFDEGIFAFVRPQKGASLTAEMVMEHCENIAAYKRPQHVEIWPPEKQFPLTRVAKVDKIALQKIAEPIVEQLRQEGEWDAGM